MTGRAGYWAQRYAEQGMRTVGNASFSPQQLDAQTHAARGLMLEVCKPYFFSGKRVLDFGCGWGRMAPVFREMGCTVEGADFAQWAIKTAQGLWPRVRFHRLTRARLPFPDAYFDGVLSWTVLQHVPPEELPSVCAELVRVVQPARGHVVLYENCSKIPDKAHVWFRQPEEYVKLFRGMRPTERRIIEDLDGTGEQHAVVVMQALP